MKDYYEVLDVPLTATPEQIKAQYRQLVRIYHPDRFMDKTDKVYAEEKLKEINIAFQVLSGAFVRGETYEQVPAPRPVAYPPNLDFGTLHVGEKGVRTVQIGNLGGDAKSVNFVYSVEQPWFTISKGKRVYADRAFPLDFQVTVDTRRLSVQQKYLEWITVELDGVPVRVPLALTVAPRPHSVRVMPPWLWGVATVLLLLIALLAAPMLGIGLPALPFSMPSATLSAEPVYALHANEMLFSVRENDISALYAGMQNGTPRRLGVVGSEAVGTHQGQMIAYLSGPAGSEQVYLFNLTNGETRQLTRSNEPKSALAWSPDGKRLGYLLGTGTATQIGIYELATGQEHDLPGEVTTGVGSFTWSPDSQSLLFNLAQGDTPYVYRIHVSGDGLQQLTDFAGEAGAWSPDGSQVAVAAKDGIYLLGSNGQHARQLTDAVATSVRWSTDGQWLAYETTENELTKGTGKTLWLLNIDSKKAQAIATDSLWQGWSPDGATLGYVTGKLGGTEPLLYLWTLTPGGTPTLVAEVSDPFFAWPQ